MRNSCHLSTWRFNLEMVLRSPTFDIYHVEWLLVSIQMLQNSAFGDIFEHDDNRQIRAPAPTPQKFTNPFVWIFLRESGCTKSGDFGMFR